MGAGLKLFRLVEQFLDWFKNVGDGLEISRAGLKNADPLNMFGLV